MQTLFAFDPPLPNCNCNPPCVELDSYMCARAKRLKGLVLCPCKAHKRKGVTLPATYRNPDQDTSILAAESFSNDTLSELQQKVLNWFMARPRKRASDDTLESALEFSEYGPTTVSKRRTDLVHMGLLRDSGERELNIRNRWQIVWEVVDKNVN